MNFETRLQHPAPQFMRDSWINLCGIWAFEFDKENVGLSQHWYREHVFTREIQVPFVYQSTISQLSADENEGADVVWYRRTLVLAPKAGQRVLLHFEACDYATTLWVNGQLVQVHQGGFSPFTADITRELCSGSNSLVVRVEDTSSPTQLLGKQSWKRENFLCWYTRSTGIWQPVWVELVPECYIARTRIEPDVDTATVKVVLLISPPHAGGTADITVRYKEKLIQSTRVLVRDGMATATLGVGCDDCDFVIDTWTPQSPNLYDLDLVYHGEGCEADTVSSYFGMRKIGVEGSRVLLNNQEFYQKLVLNQGYYGRGLMTPERVELLVEDVQKMKRCGFNGMRIHQKTETSTLLFLCDYYGLVVWSEIPSFYRDDVRAREGYWRELPEILEKQRNHPSVITWVLFNESWGLGGIYHNPSQQQFVDAAYAYVKSYDPTRLVVGNDGWEHTKTDLLTIHDYTQNAELLQNTFADMPHHVNASFSRTSQRCNFADGYRYEGQPLLISELGGIAWGGAKASSWGYGQRPESEAAVLARFGQIMSTAMGVEGVCGFCYTQWTDVEQEVNGILDAEHREKLPLEAIGQILNSMRNYGYIFE